MKKVLKNFSLIISFTGIWEKYLTHKIIGKTLSRAPINENDTMWIHVNCVHRGTLHFWIRESHLHVNIIDALKKVTEVTTRCFYQAIVSVHRKNLCFFCIFFEWHLFRRGSLKLCAREECEIKNRKEISDATPRFSCFLLFRYWWASMFGAWRDFVSYPPPHLHVL